MASNLLAQTLGNIDFGFDTSIYNPYYERADNIINNVLPNKLGYPAVYSKPKIVEEKINISRGCFIKVNPFSCEYKELVMRNVIDNGNSSRYFSGGLSLNFSKEQGFDLILSNSWLDKLKDNQYIGSHYARHVIFVERNNMVIGLRCKDNINYWTNEEKMKLQQLINIASAHYKGKNTAIVDKPNYIPGTSNYDFIPKPTTKYDDEIDVTETNFFLDKMIKSIENDSEFSKIKKYSKKLKSVDGFKIILNILKQYMKVKKTTWYDIRDSVYDVKYFIRDKLASKK